MVSEAEPFNLIPIIDNVKNFTNTKIGLIGFISIKKQMWGSWTSCVIMDPEPEYCNTGNTCYHGKSKI